MKKAKDDREAAENARIAAAVAEADKKAEQAVQKLAGMRLKMQQDCDKVVAVLSVSNTSGLQISPMSSLVLARGPDQEFCSNITDFKSCWKH